MRNNRKVVAWSRWHFPRPLKDEERGRMDPDYFDDIPTGANAPLCEEFFNKLEKIEFKYIDRENGFCTSSSRFLHPPLISPLNAKIMSNDPVINYLTVLPAYQRLGLGSKLLDIGLEEADKLGASVFLVATERGEGLYRKKGFLEVERFEIDMKPHGGELVIPFLGMTRGPIEARENGK